MSCISVHGLVKSYGNVNVVDNIELSVNSGQIFGFLGPNGAGKSTTIKLLTTLIQPNNGNITILGIDAINFPLKVRKKIGVILQQPSYEPTLTVTKSLEKYGMMWDIPAHESKKRAKQLLIDFDLVEIKNKKNEDLSIGQRRRVQVAREFMHDMELLFLDEPTVGLDPISRRNLLDYLKNKTKLGLTIFYTTHVLPEAEYICDQIAIINKGKIIAVNSPDDLKNRFSQKIVKIHIYSKERKIFDLLKNIKDCKIEINTGTDITIQSANSTMLVRVLQILNENNLEIEDVSTLPINLEEIFLKMVKNSNESNN